MLYMQRLTQYSLLLDVNSKDGGPTCGVPVLAGGLFGAALGDHPRPCIWPSAAEGVSLQHRDLGSYQDE